MRYTGPDGVEGSLQEGHPLLHQPHLSAALFSTCHNRSQICFPYLSFKRVKFRAHTLGNRTVLMLALCIKKCIIIAYTGTVFDIDLSSVLVY
jgi:hypothetical protein